MCSQIVSKFELGCNCEGYRVESITAFELYVYDLTIIKRAHFPRYSFYETVAVNVILASDSKRLEDVGLVASVPRSITKTAEDLLIICCDSLSLSFYFRVT